MSSQQQYYPQQKLQAIQDPLAPGNFGTSMVTQTPYVPTQSTLGALLPGLLGGGLLAYGLANMAGKNEVPAALLGALAGGVGGGLINNINTNKAKQAHGYRQQAINANNAAFQKNLQDLTGDAANYATYSGFDPYTNPLNLSGAESLEQARAKFSDWKAGLDPLTRSIQTKNAAGYMSDQTNNLMNQQPQTLGQLSPQIPGPGKLGNWENPNASPLRTGANKNATLSLEDLQQYNFDQSHVSSLGTAASKQAETPSNIYQNIKHGDLYAEETKTEPTRRALNEAQTNKAIKETESLDIKNKSEDALRQSQINRNNRPSGGGSKPSRYDREMENLGRNRASFNPDQFNALTTAKSSGLPVPKNIEYNPDGEWPGNIVGGKQRIRVKGKSVNAYKLDDGRYFVPQLLNEKDR